MRPPIISASSLVGIMSRVPDECLELVFICDISLKQPNKFRLVQHGVHRTELACLSLIWSLQIDQVWKPDEKWGGRRGLCPIFLLTYNKYIMKTLAMSMQKIELTSITRHTQITLALAIYIVWPQY